MNVRSLVAALPPRFDAASPARRRLLSRALELFADRGFSAVSVRDLTESLGLQPGALYAHFPSRGALLTELVVVGAETHRDRILEALLRSEPGPLQQLAAVVRAHVLVNASFPELSAVIDRDASALDAEARARVEAVVAETDRTLREILRRGRELVEIADIDDDVAVAVIAGAGARAPRWTREPSTRSAESIADSVACLAVRMVQSANGLASERDGQGKAS